MLHNSVLIFKRQRNEIYIATGRNWYNSMLNEIQDNI